VNDPAITIDLAAMRDWETGAPETDPNRDSAFDRDEPNLPPPWDMSICQLDGWNAYHAARQRLGRAPSDAERAHWDEVRGQINARHEARRRSYFS
jgi:hypothetical protein